MVADSIQNRRNKLQRGVKPKDLTSKQARILTYILECWMSGFMPSIREIAVEFGIGSPNGVACHVRALRLKGYLEEADTKRGLMLADKALELVL